MGGVDGLVDWLPIADIVAALEKLVAQRSDAMSLLYEVTGMSDIVRGANAPDRETKGASDNRKTFASIRVQALQEDFARFASDLMRLKAEVICKHFEPKTIIEDSNITRTADGQNQELIQSALKLLKEPEEAAWRIEIRPETIAMIDYDKMRQERGEFIGSVATFMQSAAPLAELAPDSMPTLITMLKWAVAGFKGSQEIEGVLDRAIEEMMKAAQAEKEQPQEEEPSEQELDGQLSKQEFEQDRQLQQEKHQQEIEKITTKARADIEELRNELNNQIKIIKAELAAAIRGEDAQADAAMEQDDHSTENKIKVKKTPGASNSGGTANVAAD
jgi:hypothetical protein